MTIILIGILAWVAICALCAASFAASGDKP